MEFRPTVRQLEYLVAIAETLHFGRAARRCAVTQPALSAQIQQLEEALGARLFERGRSGVTVTAEGEVALVRARAALKEVDELVSSARSAGRPLTGRLRLGVIPTVAPYLLPPLLPKVRRRWPELHLVLREEQTTRLVTQLQEGRLDLLALALPVEEASLVELPLYEEPFLFLAPRDHPLVRRRTRLTERDLHGQEVLLLEDGHCLRSQALDICERAGARESDRLQATSLGTLVQMVANGLGVTLVPERAVPIEVRNVREIATKAFRGRGPGRSIGLAWRRNSAREDEFRLLGDFLAKAAKRPRS